MYYFIWSIIVIVVFFIIGYAFSVFFKNREIQTCQEDFKMDDQLNAPKTKELVLYYAMWCGYSKQFLPVWEKVKETLKDSDIKVTDVRCEDSNEQICMQKGVEGYPTIVLYSDNQEIKYSGDRSLESVVNFAKS